MGFIVLNVMLSPIWLLMCMMAMGGMPLSSSWYYVFWVVLIALGTLMIGPMLGVITFTCLAKVIWKKYPSFYRGALLASAIINALLASLAVNLIIDQSFQISRVGFVKAIFALIMPVILYYGACYVLGSL